jgi:hypothetical protein
MQSNINVNNYFVHTSGLTLLLELRNLRRSGNCGGAEVVTGDYRYS